jgi:hypothetical protein
MSEPSDYEKYRGKCKEMSEQAVMEDPSLTLVRGYYWCPIWGKQEHWWTRRPDGAVNDPTKDQFPSKGIGYYEEFNGIFECAECGKEVHESEAYFDSRYAFCSGRCNAAFVGVYV